MKLVLLCSLVAAAIAAPHNYNPESAQVLKYENESEIDGNYRFGFEQTDGTKAEATGKFHPGSGKDNEGYVAIRGSYDWVGEDGVNYSATYEADENGYRPTYKQGPGGVIPDAIIQSLPSP